MPLAPASKTVSASTANSARGIPNVIATRSAANEPISALLRRTNESPSRIDCRIGGCSVSVGAGSRRGRVTVMPSMNRNPTAWIVYAEPIPTAAIIRPPMPGPTTAAT